MATEQLHTLLRQLRRLAVSRESSGLSDAQLLERFVAARDEAAFEVLVWRHGPMVLSMCRRVLRHEQDAEDSFQATFLALARKASSIGKRQALASWLYKVAFRIALEAKRGRHQICSSVKGIIKNIYKGPGEAVRYLEPVFFIRVLED
jgi:DNA-directed RNA polymerase specialized sigma24 family protein